MAREFSVPEIEAATIAWLSSIRRSYVTLNPGVPYNPIPTWDQVDARARSALMLAIKAALKTAHQ